ncbi:MAG: 30S ribosomal protein S27e [Promethearchaeota archaeon]
MSGRELIPFPRSKFLRVRCPECKTEQIVFGCAKTVVNCEACGKVLVEPTGGKGRVTTVIISVLD